MIETPLPRLRDLIQAQPAHYTIADVGEACGVTRQAAAQWEAIPEEHAATVGKLFNKHPSELRPDIFKPAKARGKRK